MPDEFQFDVFLSHSAKDKAVVRPLAERLRADGVSDNSQHSTFNSQLPRGSDWAQLESGTFRFRDPLNKERRFLPLRLDDARFSLWKKERALPVSTAAVGRKHQPCVLYPGSHRD